MNEKYVIPEVHTLQEWYLLTDRRSWLTKEEEQKIKYKNPHLREVQDHQILLCDVYTNWSGPCVAIESHLRRMRHTFVEAPDVLKLARVCCDDIKDLEAFAEYLSYLKLFSK